MPATGHRRGNLVYHWKHGYIPLDHYAALQKAHHSKTGAVKEMEKRGIPVPKGYKSDHKPSAPTVAPKAAPKATRAKVRDLPAADTFKGVHSETHMGERVTVRKGKQWGTIQSEINGHVVGTGYGHSNADAVKHLDSTKGTVAHAKANPANYTNGFGEASYGMKLGAKAPAAPKASPAPTHSAGMDPHAIRATQLREAAAKKRAEAERIAGSVGAPDRAGAMLRAKDSARMNARMDSGLRRFTEKQREATALEHQARLAEGRSKEAARPKLTHEDVKGATHVRDQYGWHEVVRVNAKTVTVKTPYSWTDSIPHHKVHQVLRATPEQIAAAKAKAARKK